MRKHWRPTRMYCGIPANDLLHGDAQPSQNTKASCARTRRGIQGGNEVNFANIPENAMAPVKIVQPAMTATIQIGDLDRVTRRKLKVVKTTNGRRIKPIVMSIGMGGMAQSLPQSRAFTRDLASS